jgi:hypothetical protein
MKDHGEDSFLWPLYLRFHCYRRQEYYRFKCEKCDESHKQKYQWHPKGVKRATSFKLFFVLVTGFVIKATNLPDLCD